MAINLYSIYIFLFLLTLLRYAQTLSVACRVCGGKGFLWGKYGPCKRYRDVDFSMDKDCPTCPPEIQCTVLEKQDCPRCNSRGKAMVDMQNKHRSEGMQYG